MSGLRSSTYAYPAPTTGELLLYYSAILRCTYLPLSGFPLHLSTIVRVEAGKGARRESNPEPQFERRMLNPVYQPAGKVIVTEVQKCLTTFRHMV